MRVMGLEATAFDSPVIAKFVSNNKHFQNRKECMSLCAGVVAGKEHKERDNHSVRSNIDFHFTCPL